MSTSENRKVGGSTPPLATTVTAGQTSSDLRFVVLQAVHAGPVSGLV